VTVRHAGTATAATIYADEGITPKANPFTGDAQGRLFFYAPDGLYDVVLSATGFAAYTIEDVAMADTRRGGWGLTEDLVYSALANAYYDRNTTQWLRRDVAKAVWGLETDAVNDRLRILRAAAAANPITWTELLRIDAAGLLTIPGTATGGALFQTLSTGTGLRVEEATPASTGVALAKIIGGSTSTRISTLKHGLILQLYPAASWSDPGVAYSPLNIRFDVPAGVNFHPWALTSVVSSAAALDTLEHAAGFFRAEGSGGSPLWALAAEVEDRVSGVSAAASLVGLELLFYKRHASSVITGLDLVAAGDQNADRAIRIRRGTVAQGERDWLVGIRFETPTIPMVWREIDVALGDGTGAARMRYEASVWGIDVNKGTVTEFSTIRTPLAVEGLGDVYLGGHPTIGDDRQSLLARRNALGLVAGTGALATSATDGFWWIPSMAGAATGTPTAFTGRVAMVYDTTNNRLRIYNGGWVSVLLA
jgi:hypothetical protein